MTLPCAELKVESILNTPTKTVCTLVLYRVTDAGRDAQGQPRYARVEKRRRRVVLDAGWDAPRILAAARARLLVWAEEEGFNLPPERLVCTL